MLLPAPWVCHTTPPLRSPLGRLAWHVGVRQLQHRRIDGGGGDAWVEALQGPAQAGREDHLAEVAALGGAGVAVELGGEDVGVTDVLEPLKALLLQMVLPDAE